MSTYQSSQGRYGVHSIDHFALEIPDLAQGKFFFDSFGLRVEEKPEGLELYACDTPHRWGRLFKGAHKRLAYLALNCYEQDLEPLREQVKTAGGRFATPHPLGTGEGFWLRDADDNLVQVRVGEKTMPDSKKPASFRNAAANERAVLGRSSYGKIHPRRLSHVLMFTPDVLRQVKFYEAALGMRMSDRAQDLIAFTHARHGSDHHMIALAKSEAKGWHHSSWDVPGIDEVGQGADQMEQAGFKAGWGTGRHVLGSNYFHYVQDPWGSFAEYSADIDHIPKGEIWDTGDWPPEDSLYLWGPPVPEIFLANAEANLVDNPSSPPPGRAV
ncbi:MAG: metapyrocatechase [Betaproteobacteria bacterium RIFCSPLOWO2_02_FULL_63_19]|nr:MAG: metapyrocatechase [Betaproteobacteria bacterium RIFCSPLOWO2_02_FULL_63_19]